MGNKAAAVLGYFRVCNDLRCMESRTLGCAIEAVAFNGHIYCIGGPFHYINASGHVDLEGEVEEALVELFAAEHEQPSEVYLSDFANRLDESLREVFANQISEIK